MNTSNINHVHKNVKVKITHKKHMNKLKSPYPLTSCPLELHADIILPLPSPGTSSHLSKFTAVYVFTTWHLSVFYNFSVILMHQ